MTTAAPEQLAFPTDARADDLAPAAVAGVEARIEHDDHERGRYAPRARPCRCRRPWGEAGHCCRCGHDTEARR